MMANGILAKKKQAIIEILRATPQIERAILFGSRAMETFTPESDIDIALIGDELTIDTQAQLQTQMDELNIPQEIDFLLYATTTSEDIKKHIKKYGVAWYNREGAECWRVFKLKEVVEITSSKRVKFADYIKSGVPFFRSKEIIDLSKRNNISTELFISEKQFSEIEKKYGAPKEDDILLTSVGTLGVPYQVRKGDKFYFKDGNLTWFKNYSEKIEPKYLLCWLTSSIAKEKFAEIAIGSTQQALTIIALKSIEIILPPIAEQKTIASVLGTLDDKIELNRKISETLEAIAQAIFKSWFVDFDPVKAKIATLETGGSAEDAELAAMSAISGKNKTELAVFKKKSKQSYQKLANTAALFPAAMQASELGKIPKNWELTNLGAILNPKKGQSITKKTATHGDIPVIAGGLNPAYYHNIANIKAPVITASASGANAGYINLYYQDIWASDCSYINKTQTNYIYSMYSLLKSRQEEIFGMQQGVAQPHIYPSDLMRLIITNAPDNIWLACEKILVPFYDSISKKKTENKTLIETRDTLLPKLLSGEIDLNQTKQPKTKEVII